MSLFTNVGFAKESHLQFTCESSVGELSGEAIIQLGETGSGEYDISAKVTTKTQDLSMTGSYLTQGGRRLVQLRAINSSYFYKLSLDFNSSNGTLDLTDQKNWTYNAPKALDAIELINCQIK